MSKSKLSNDDLIKIWLDEYKVLAADVQNRVTLQQTLMNYLLILVSASLVAFTGLLKDQLYSQYEAGMRIAVMVLPILFSFFVWRHANHDLNIIDKASYINKVIRPNLIVLTGDASLLGWDRYVDVRRKQRRRYGFLMLLSGEHTFYLLFSFLSLLAAIYAFWGWQRPISLFSIFSSIREWIGFSLAYLLLFVDTILFILTIRMKIRIGYAYCSIVNESSDIWC